MLSKQHFPLVKSVVSTMFLLAYMDSCYASCGSAFCVLNTSWDIQDPVNQVGRARLDLRFEFIDQDHLRSGNSNISAAEDTGDTTEIKTINRNFVATLDYSFTPQVGVSASLPIVSRYHSHIADPSGAAQVETWNFSKVSDARITGRYQFEGTPDSVANYGLQLGVKLPTGDDHITNAEGIVAERALQPGTGSTDVIIGGYFSNRPHSAAMTWFAQGNYQRAMATRDGYRPGDQLSATGGLRYPFSESVSGLFQLNLLLKQKDSGPNAESELSGGKFLFASPGLSYGVTRDTQIYGFVQLPVYRYVNGIQLSANWSAIGGVSMRF